MSDSNREILQRAVCDAPNCSSSSVTSCTRCSRPLCTWHHLGEANGAPVCFPTCGADFWTKGGGVLEARPAVVGELAPPSRCKACNAAAVVDDKRADPVVQVLIVCRACGKIQNAR